MYGIRRDKEQKGRMKKRREKVEEVGSGLAISPLPNKLHY
jgi:hypothetical protein